MKAKGLTTHVTKSSIKSGDQKPLKKRGGTEKPIELEIKHFYQMKTKNLTFTIMGLLLILSISCDKDSSSTPINPIPTGPVPILITSTVSNIGVNYASCGGEITTDNGLTVTARGVCWSLNPTPTINDNKTIDGSGAGTYISEITDLNLNSQYFVRAYATNSAGTGYGSTMTFNTSHVDLPELGETRVYHFEGDTAWYHGEIISDGGSELIEYGICWNTNPNPTPADNKSMPGSYRIPLSPYTLYYARIYAKNILGTSYGNEISFNSGYNLGQFIEGGIVFYNDGEGHGLVCTHFLLHHAAQWGCHGTTLGGTSRDFGTGAANTSAIVNKCSEDGIAARLCSDLELYEYTDWFLPSIEELKLIHSNLYMKGLGGFGYDDYYWSSTENDYYDAHGLRFSDGHIHKEHSKNSGLMVRAVRAF